MLHSDKNLPQLHITMLHLIRPIPELKTVTEQKFSMCLVKQNSLD